jgi:hypothetical protein
MRELLSPHNGREYGLQEEKHEHGQEKRKQGKRMGKSDERVKESKARQTEALHCAQT